MTTTPGEKDLLLITLGGSIVAPQGIDSPFLASFVAFFKRWLAEHSRRKLILIVGGGHPARLYQEAYRHLVPTPLAQAEDWLGIRATHLNAQLVKILFGEDALAPLLTNPKALPPFEGRVLVGGGWKPGFSTDYVSVVVAEHFRLRCLLNLSNIDKIYDDDPRKNLDAQALQCISWDEYRKMAGGHWFPGMHLPFDPIASQEAERLQLQVVTASGRDLPNLRRLLEGQSFVGTTIGPSSRRE